VGLRPGLDVCGYLSLNEDSILRIYIYIYITLIILCADCTGPISAGLTIIPIITFLRCRLRIHKRFIANAFKYATAVVLRTLNVLRFSLVLPSHGVRGGPSHGVRGGPVDVGTALQAESSRGRFPMW
jgi:hypothetical protein